MDNCLVGKIIMGMKIADDRKAIQFTLADGVVVAKCDGDCCSDTWVESIELPAMGFPCFVQSAEDLSLPDEEENEDGECIAHYGLKLVTDKGHIAIDYRNSSNGYYGGNLSWPDDRYFYGGVHGQNVSTENWVEIK